VREPNERRLLIRQQAEAQGIGQQRSRESTLIPGGHQPPKVTAEGPDLPGELLTLGSSLVMVEMPDPAPARRVTDQELPGFVQDLHETVAQGRQAQRDRDVRHDDPAEDDDPRLPGPESFQRRWNSVHSPRPSGVVEEAIR
jgi:hypothetical protein